MQALLANKDDRALVPILHETQFLIDEVNLKKEICADFPVDQIRGEVSKKLLRITQEFVLNEVIPEVTMAVHLSLRHQVHFVSWGLNSDQHTRLVSFLRQKGMEGILSSLPKGFRNKYFELKFKRDGVHSSTVKFAWDFEFYFPNQLETGFGKTSTHLVRPFDRASVDEFSQVRFELIGQRRSQETGAGCGISSLVQVLAAREIRVTEHQLVEKMAKLGIKSKRDFYEVNPGIDLVELGLLARELGCTYGFSSEVWTLGDGNIHQGEFSKSIMSSINAGNKDIIVNYFSPMIGRPGSGHFSPIAGFNYRTNEILLSETNLAVNPPVWVRAQALYQAMRSSAPEVRRGFLVMTW